MLTFNVRPLLACRLRVALPLLVVTPCVALAVPVHADAPVVGVRAWTGSSQTYVRVRPSALTPPVAKVPANTKLYVWGRFNNWYRVETHDHIFGWVHAQYIKSPDLKKVKVLSHFKAKQGSDQGASQTLYGTAAELKAYYVQYGGTGALRGLALKGIYLSPNSTLAQVVGASANHKPAPVRVASNPQLAPHVPTSPQSRPALPSDNAESIKTAQTLGNVSASMAPAASSLAGAVRSWTPGTSSPSTVATSPIIPAPTVSATRVEGHAGNVNPYSIAPSIQSTPVPAPITLPRVITPVVSAPSVQFSGSGQPLAPVLPGSNVLMAPAPRTIVAATKPAPKIAATSSRPLTAEQKHIIAWQARKHAKDQHWLWLQKKKANDYKWRVAQAQKKAEANRNRHEWLAKQHENRSRYLASRKSGQRSTLGQSVGLAPKTLPTTIPGTLAPISPDELLKARDQYIKKSVPQPVTQAAPLSTSSGTPFLPSGLPMPGSSDDLKGNLNVLLFGTTQQKKEAALELSAFSAGESQDGQGASNAASTPSSSSMPVPYVPAAPAQSVTSAAPSRGGSPRDRAMAAWRNGVATQALSYRGMPYIFGAASPSHGFDCSGLIYFLLRQRGLNPPRTAAGYRSYGTAVARGQWQTGDLILFANTYKRGISHIGVYLKDGKFIHAANSQKGVRVDSLNSSYYASKYWGARRVK